MEQDARIRWGHWFRDEAWRFTPWQLYEKWADRTFDLRHGTDTSGKVELRSLDIDSPNRHRGQRYQASPVFSLRQVIGQLQLDHSTFSFVDFGSGKGRALLVASGFPFRQVIGVEFSAELNASAARNIVKFTGKRAASVTAVTCDASRFEAPDGDLLLYFFNPFHRSLVLDVLRNVLAQPLHAPRRIVVVFLYLPDPALFDALPAFRLVRHWRRYDVYQADVR